MKKRAAIPRKKSKRMFSKHAAKTHRRNMPNMGPNRMPMRGGIRL